MIQKKIGFELFTGLLVLSITACTTSTDHVATGVPTHSVQQEESNVEFAEEEIAEEIEAEIINEPGMLKEVLSGNLGALARASE